MMRHSCLFRPVSGLLGSILIYMAVTCSVSSCTDDTFNKYQQEDTGLLTFDVKVPGNWTNGLSRAATDISIKRMSQSAHAEPLYLVTEISEVAADAAASDAAAEDAVTRGSTVNSTDNFHTNFGLSAICYTGTWPDGDPTNWHTDFAHNLKVTKKETSWESAEKLNWLGTGGIRFFAYSPYSSSDNGIVHSDKNQGGIPTLTYTVPKDVTKQHDLMTATQDCPGGQGGAVVLKFEHVLTAITIKTGEKMLAGKVTGITISGVYGKGTCQIGAKEWTLEGTPDSTFSIKEDVELDWSGNDLMTNPNIELNKDKEGYTFMMIPQTLTDKATLTIAFTDSITKTARTLTAKLKEFTKDNTWVAGKKYTYSVSSTGIVVEPVFEMKINRNGQLPNGGYKFGEGSVFGVANTPITDKDKEEAAYLPVSGVLRDVEITAYTRVTHEGDETKTLELPFKIEYSFDEGKNWESGDKTYGWKPVSDIAVKTAEEPAKGNIILPAQSSFTASQSAFNNILTEDGEKDYNLVARNKLSKHSANCYIVRNHGHYKFPAYYGNTYNNDDYKAYSCDLEVTDEVMVGKILRKFVAGDNSTVANGKIQGIEKAVLIWQDSPDLVTEVEYKEEGGEGWVHFYVPRESINQGNAVIAVLDNSGNILWSWHIWATHYNWEDSSIPTGVNNEKGAEFLFSPCNLGYCDSHEGDKERPVWIRIKATVPGKGEINIKPNIISGVSHPDENGVIAFTQPAVIASIAGDNTYYQWGRKDPMLPGVYNEEIRSSADKNEQYDIINKVFYSIPKYRFTAKESTVPIGQTIREPFHFFMHQRPKDEDKNENPDDYNDQNYKRRHWHDGWNASYQTKTIANFWNSQLIQNGTDGSAATPNNTYVIKTVYDPSPAGYKVPPPSVFSTFVKADKPLGSNKAEEAANKFEAIPVGDINIGWKLTTRSGYEVTFPSTGLRDMGVVDRTCADGTWSAHSKLTFIITAGFQGKKEVSASSSALLFSIDYREHALNGNRVPCIEQPLGIIYGTNNAYGFTVRPIRDGQTGTGN